MWLLNTHTAKLKFFPSPEAVPGGYAILSHVWGNPAPPWDIKKGRDEEDTFQKVQRAFEECRESVPNAANILASATPSDDAPVETISSLYAQVNDLSAQVQNLTTRLHALVLALKEHNPAFTELLSAHRPSTPDPQYVPTDNGICDATNTIPRVNARDCLSPKVRNFLLKAEEDGLDWAWADTCCIDKTSSAELTEAINSMFQYYYRSEICYAYLSDVRPAAMQGELPWEFKLSAWHKRGWTLQELIAPKVVVFMTNGWTRIGTKYELAYMMEQGIEGCPPASVLRFEKEITDISVAQRMSWASSRQTTRVEDEAYCLFGLFGINMPTLYGEGQNAFYRLQEEIMRTSTDTSIIAWERKGLFTGWRAFKNGIKRANADQYADFGYLFASSPSNFKSSRNIFTTVWENALQPHSSVSLHVSA